MIKILVEVKSVFIFTRIKIVLFKIMDENVIN